MSDQCSYLINFAEPVSVSPKSHCDCQSPTEVSFDEQICDICKEVKICQDGYKRSFLGICSNCPPQLSRTGCAIVAISGNQSIANSELRERFNHVGYDNCILENPSMREFVQAAATLVWNIKRGYVHTPVLIGISGLGTKDALCFSDGELKMALILRLLHCIPSETPVVLLLECMDSMGNDNPVTPYPFCHQNHVYYHVKRSADDFPRHSLFRYLLDQLHDPTPRTFKSIIHTFDNRLNGQSTIITATGGFQDVSPQAIRQSQAGMPCCGCGNCSILTLCSSECPTPNHMERIPALCHSMPALSPSQSISTNQVHILTLSLQSVLQLLQKYCHMLLEADPDDLQLQLCNYYPDFTIASHVTVDLNLVTEFLTYVIEHTSWVTDMNLKRFRDMAKALNIEEAVKVIDTMESTLDLFLHERLVQTTEMIHYPYNGGCTCKPHFLFMVDKDFQKLPHSIFPAVHACVSEGIKKRKGVDPYVSFVTIQNAALHGFNVKSPS